MIANGALFGVLIGSLLSLIGGLGASLMGFWIGKKGDAIVEKWVTKPEMDNATRLLQRWGGLAIILSRPVPILAETVSILAGMGNISFGKMALCSTLGLIPAALLYAYTGSVATDMESGSLAFLLVIGVAAVFWLVGKWMSKSSPETH